MIFLIVDDNPRMREAVKRSFIGKLPNDHVIHDASDGEEAIQMYDKVNPDWVLMDVRMEPVDGLAASRSILKQHPSAKIIIISNYDDAGYRRAAQEIGVVAYVVKERLSEIPGIVAGHHPDSAFSHYL